MAGKVWQENKEMAHPIASTVSKQRVRSNAYTMLACFILFCLWSQPMGCYCPHLQWAFPLNLIKKSPHKYVQKLITSVILESIKLTILTITTWLPSTSLVIHNFPPLFSVDSCPSHNEKYNQFNFKSPYCCREASCWFLAAQHWNNHTETILFKSLLSPLALASY